MSMSNKYQNKKESKKAEFAKDLSPDDLDIREENELSKEQLKNSTQQKEIKKPKKV